MNHSHINQAAERYYDNLKLILHNIIPGCDVGTIPYFRLTYKNLRAFIRMLGEQQGARTKFKISCNLRKTYNLLGHIRNLYLQQVKISNHQNADYSSLQQYLLIRA